MELRWKNNPHLWDRMYKSNRVFALTELGTELGIPENQIKIELTETPLPLRELKGKIADFWETFVEEHPKAYNNPVLATTGIDALTIDRGEAVLRAFVSDYALSVLKNALLQKEELNLTEEQGRFLQLNFLCIGASGYTKVGNEYLLGQRTDRGPTNRLAGLIQYLPQGLAVVEGNCQDAIERTIARELTEETGLDITNDCDRTEITHVLTGTLNGDLTIVYHLALKPESKDKVIADKTEVEQLFYISPSEIKRRLAHSAEKRLFSPVTASLFDKLGEENKI